VYSSKCTNMPNTMRLTTFQNRRLTIGFLNASGLQFFHSAWRGVADVAREHDINAISFIGQYVRDTKSFNAQANILYDLINTEQLDGLVIQDLMSNLLDPADAQEFYDRYCPLPIVSIGRRPIQGVPRAQSNGYEGMRKAIVHLVEVHDRRKIAFIKGLPNYWPFEERYQAYLDVLNEHDVVYDSARVAEPLNAAEADHPDWGRVALCRLLDEQNADFDALVTNDDRFAHNLLPELQERNIQVPDDIALVSFDDEEGSNCLTPPLTTVPIPIYELGRQAAEMLVAKMNGHDLLDEVVDVPSDRLILRQSCGCLDPKVTQVVAGPIVQIAAEGPIEATLAKQRNRIAARLTGELNKLNVDGAAEGAERLFDTFTAAIFSTNEEELSADFLSSLDRILRHVIANEGDINGLSEVLTVFRRELLPFLSVENAGSISRNQAEDLWLQAQTMIGRTAQRERAYRELQAEKRKRILNEIAADLATNFDLNNLADILTRELPRLGISRGYLSLYENPDPYQYPQAAPEWSRLVLAYDSEEPEGSRRFELEEGGRRFPSRQLVPPEFLPQNGIYRLIVQALYFRDEQIGFTVFEDGPDEGAIYELLRAQISSALKGDMLFQEAQQARLAAEKADQIKTRLLANVSHELRTPLNIILGYSRDVLKTPDQFGTETPQELLEDIEHIYNSAEHQLRVVNDLLDLSRAEIDELDLYLEYIDPYPLLQDAFDSITHSADESNVTWRLELPERLPLIKADPVRLRQILLNLLSNAQKYTNQGEVLLGTQVEPPNLHLWVKDTGEGITSGMQEQIFEPFVKAEETTRRPEGIGLGLSITRRLVALHGGSMKLESKPGHGSTFHVYLPLPNLSDKTIPVTEPTNPVLLLITATDQPTTEIVELSRRRGLGIQKLHTGDDLDTLLSKVQPTALAWDLAAVSTNEWALVRRIRNHPLLNQVPFILYGYSESASHSIGLTSVVTKPINAHTLLEAIDALNPQELTGAILIVDDDPLTRQAHQNMIAQGLPGYPVCSVGDGAAALEAMADQPPSLVLLDLMMPEMDGFEVLDRMRANPHTLAVPVIILTSKVLNLEDIKRIEQHTHVIVQSKGVLADEEMVAALHRSLFGTESLPSQTSAMVKRAVAYMHQNYTRPLKRWEVAAAINASENYFSRVFSQELGLSPWDYLNRFRINQAKELIRHSQENFKSIAAQVGFKDPKYFSRVFSKLTGLSPSEFRNQPNS